MENGEEDPTTIRAFEGLLAQYLIPALQRFNDILFSTIEFEEEENVKNNTVIAISRMAILSPTEIAPYYIVYLSINL